MMETKGRQDRDLLYVGRSLELTIRYIGEAHKGRKKFFTLEALVSGGTLRKNSRLTFER